MSDTSEFDTRKSIDSSSSKDVENYYDVQLADPDLLWKRKGNFSSIGAVDELGHFEIDIDIERLGLSELNETSSHTKMQSMQSRSRSGFGSTFKKMIGVPQKTFEEEQELAANVAKSFLHDLVAQAVYK